MHPSQTPRLLRFALRVGSAFLRNRGILLAGGVGYNILLSIIPLFALLVVLLSHLVDEGQLLELLALQAHHLTPAHADLLLDAVRGLLKGRDGIGLMGLGVLLLFSSFAFRMLEDALAIIFHAPDLAAPQRRFWVSVLLPYAFMLMLGLGLLALTLSVSLTATLGDAWQALTGHRLPLAGLSGPMLNLVSFLGVFALFSAIYKVLPVVRVAPKRALAGGFVAALLWEGVRLLLLFYFTQLSLVNVVYGSVATLIVVLLSLEAGAIILLLGAQVIAELEHNARQGLAWHIDPRRQPVTRVE